MAQRVTPTSLDAAALHVSYNIPHTQMAVVDHTGTISTWQRDGQSRDWIVESNWSPDGLAITCICWAAPEFGNVLCAGSTDGIVCIWAQSPEGEWTKRAQIAAAPRAATQACFAPRQMGPIAAVAFADGSVRTFIAASPLDATTWDPYSHLQLDHTSGACISLSWREFDPVLPPLLAVGTAAGIAEVWMFQEQLLRWERATRLGPDDTASKDPVSAVAWAPRLGRPFELIAVAAGRFVTLWSLVGAVNALQVESVAVLEHDENVWQLGWNMMGTWLAASTDGGEVCLWRPDLSGEWQLFNKITGGASADESDMQ